MNEYRKQHYLPQFMLKRFSPYFYNNEASKDEKNSIYRFDKKYNAIVDAKVSSSAYEEYYYSFYQKDGELNHNIEKTFGIIENNVVRSISTIDKMVERYKINGIDEGISENDEAWIFAFVYSTLIRTPGYFGKGRDQIKIFVKEHYSDLDDFAKERIERQMSAKFLNDRLKLHDNQIFEAICDRNVIIGYCRRSQRSFITSDAPIFSHNDSGPNGLVYDSTEIYFPISQDICLILAKNNLGKKILHIEQLDYIDQINDRILAQTNRYAFGSSKEVFGNK